MIKSYGVPASRTARSLWMLEELGLEYESTPTHFVGGAQQSDHLRLNPSGKVPALDDSGTIVWESPAINLYLARKYGTDGFWPDSESDLHKPSADLNACSVLSWAPTLGRMDLSSFPNVSRWLHACTNRPSLARVFGDG